MCIDHFSRLWRDAWRRILRDLGPKYAVCLECGTKFPRQLARAGLSLCCWRPFLDQHGVHGVDPVRAINGRLSLHPGRRHASQDLGIDAGGWRLAGQNR